MYTVYSCVVCFLFRHTHTQRSQWKNDSATALSDASLQLKPQSEPRQKNASRSDQEDSAPMVVVAPRVKRKHRKSISCSRTLTSIKQRNHQMLSKHRKTKGQNQSQISGDEKPKKLTSPNRRLAECRWKKQSMSCFFGRRAGKPNAIIRKRPIENAVAGEVEANKTVVKKNGPQR